MRSPLLAALTSLSVEISGVGVGVGGCLCLLVQPPAEFVKSTAHQLRTACRNASRALQRQGLGGAMLHQKALIRLAP